MINTIKILIYLPIIRGGDCEIYLNMLRIYISHFHRCKSVFRRTFFLMVRPRWRLWPVACTGMKFKLVVETRFYVTQAAYIHTTAKRSQSQPPLLTALRLR